MKWYNNYDVKKIDKIMNQMLEKVAKDGELKKVNTDKLF